MIILGIDHGIKRIGIALSDEMGLLAHAEGFIERTSDAAAIKEISQLVISHSITKAVVGLPKTLKGETGSQAKLVLTFVERLRAQLSCEVITWDERLTTAQAEKGLIAQDVSRAKRQVKRDAISAELMLQSYLDYLKETNRDHV